MEDDSDNYIVVDHKIYTKFYTWLSKAPEESKIGIFGDYDVDGIMSTAMMCKMLKVLKYTNVHVKLPSRYREGYGCSEEIFKYFQQEGCEYLIVLDSGTNSLEMAIQYFGDKVLIVDHHQADTEKQPHPQLINPVIDNGDLHPVSTTGLVLQFAMCVGLFPALIALQNEILVAAALSLLSDSCYLTVFTRRVIKKGIAIMNSKDSPEWIMRLCASLDMTEVTQKDLQFKIIPIMNAAGRLELPDSVYNCVVNGAGWREPVMLNKNRQMMTAALVKETEFLQFKNICVYYKPVIPIGLVGLVAANLASKHKIPAIVLTKTKDKLSWEGSARSVDGIDLLETVKKEAGDLLEGIGGHKMAFGLTTKDPAALKERLEKVSEFITFETLQVQTVDITVKDIGQELRARLQDEGPYGQGFPEPLFSVEGKLEMISSTNKGCVASLSDGKNCKHCFVKSGVDLNKNKHIVSVVDAFGDFDCVVVE